jgi:DNA-binding XRE family transcriptional regulator
MKELRAERSIRLLFAFDPRIAILLVGGHKGDEDSGSAKWNTWYDLYVPIADNLYDQHLTQLKKERTDLMPATKKFSALRDQAKKDPVRAKRIADTKAAALREQAEYQLSELRQALGITQAELAAMIGKSQSAVSQIESGEIGLSIELLRSIIAQLGGELQLTAIFNDRQVLLDA